MMQQQFYLRFDWRKMQFKVTLGEGALRRRRGLPGWRGEGCGAGLGTGAAARDEGYGSAIPGAGRNLRASGVDHGAPARRKPQVLGVGGMTGQEKRLCWPHGPKRSAAVSPLFRD